VGIRTAIRGVGRTMSSVFYIGISRKLAFYCRLY
jgi:hypothetical protein